MGLKESTKKVSTYFGKKLLNVGVTKAEVPTILDALEGLMPMGYDFRSATINNHLIYAYGKNPYVYSVITYIAKNIATLPYLNMPDYINNRDINISATSLLTTGNTFQKKGGAIGFDGTQDITFISTREMEIMSNTFYEVTGYKQTFQNGSHKIYEPEQIIHTDLPNILGVGEKALWGLSPLNAAITTYEASNNIKEAEASIFKNMGVTGILTNDTDVPILESERDSKDEDFKLKTAGAGRFGKVALSNIKLRYLPLGLSPTQLKMVDSNIEKLRTICSIYGINSVLFNDQVSSSFNNVNTATRNAYTEVIIPMAEIIIEKLNEDLGTNITIDKANIDALKEITTEGTADED